MRLGMFMMPVHPPGRTLWSTLDEDSEKSVLADPPPRAPPRSRDGG